MEAADGVDTMWPFHACDPPHFSVYFSQGENFKVIKVKAVEVTEAPGL
jgi:hypothetical protein